jgi:hypothetical protein
MKNILLLIFIVSSIFVQAQNPVADPAAVPFALPTKKELVYVDSVYSSFKIKEFKRRSILFGVKQVTEEVLSTKYDLSENGNPVLVDLCFVGNPSKSIRIAGIGGSEDLTVVRVKLYYKGQVYEGEGVSEVSVSTIFIELIDELPFSQTTLSSAVKKAIIDAVSKM